MMIIVYIMIVYIIIVYIIIVYIQKRTTSERYIPNLAHWVRAK